LCARTELTIHTSAVAVLDWERLPLGGLPITDASKLQVFDHVIFDLIAADWARHESAWRERQVALLRETLRVWQGHIVECAAEYRQLASRGEWVHGPADFLGVLGRRRNETHHSAVLAWLLDPMARHGLGTGMLDRVLDACFPDQDPLRAAVRSVECEVTRGDTRADIIVWGERLTLIIENKVDAQEGFRQCDRLFEQFGTEPGARFVLLTPRGSRPRTATGEAADAFATLSYRQLGACLHAALAAVDQAEPTGSTVASDYLKTLEAAFT